MSGWRALPKAEVEPQITEQVEEFCDDHQSTTASSSDNEKCSFSTELKKIE